MNTEPLFRPWQSAHRSACLAIFDENCPEYFAVNERGDYSTFLDSRPEHYVVCMVGDRIVGAYGLYPVDRGGTALHWILISPSAQGLGLGSIMMSRVVDDVRGRSRFPLHISASHKSAPFFARFGAVEISTVTDGWGPGMHRVEMCLTQAR
jgi:GNAT superfamily N-acetyltransferase